MTSVTQASISNSPCSGSTVTRSHEAQSIARILSSLLRLGLLARARDDDAWGQETSTPDQGL